MNFSYLKTLSESRYFRNLSIIIFCGLVIISALLTYTTPKAPRIALSPQSSNFIYTAKSKNFSAKIGAKRSNIPVITFETRKGASATFALENSKPEKVSRSGNSVTFKNSLPDTDLVYSTLVNGLKEEIILNKPTGVNEYIFNLNTQNAKPIKNGENSYSTSFYDNQNNLQFYIEKPFAVDAKGNRTEDVQIMIRKSADRADEFQLKLTVSPSWLNAKDRQYPVSIDPTLIYDSTAEFATGIFNRVKDTQQGVLATGGTITFSGGYTIHTFTSSGTFTPLQAMNVEALVVAGGGGGGGYGGGGGGGGIQYSASLPVTAQAYTITVGNGGGGGNGASNTWTQGSDGTNSVFSSLTAVGGGGGGGYNTPNGRNGGSGGGAANSSGSIGTGSQGFNGGTGSHSYGSYTSSGGGGGAGAVGSNASGGVSGNGGVGAAYSISGASVTYGGGGGGGGINSSAGSGGNGGGGNGATGAGANGSNGTANTGGGGGGNSGNGGTGGTGGSGIVIIRYPSTPSLETFYQDLTADPFTVGLWHMNESADNSCSGGQDVCDFSGYANHGTFVGNAALTTTAITGAKATTYDGTGDYTTIASQVSFADTRDFTIELWYKGTDTAQNTDHGKVLVGRNNSDIYANLVLRSGYVEYVHYSGSWLHNIKSTTLVADGNWHHIAYINKSNEKGDLYIDGKLEVSNASSSIGNDTYPYRIDGFMRGYNNVETSGIIDEVRVSNIARTSEEIKSSASRRPYSVFTSEVIDLTGTGSWNPLTWSELGVNTGDGETVKDATSLVAQWNFNETSGTTADNAEGTAALDGTLTNFASTSSQDAAAGTGWTSANNRWGAGALMLDGSNDYVGLGTNSSLSPTAALTAEAWINIDNLSINRSIVSKSGASGNYGWSIGTSTSSNPVNAVRFLVSSNGTTLAYRDSAIALQTGQWYHVVGTYDGSNLNVYINGKISNGTLTGTVPGSIYASSAPGNIGWTNCNGTCTDYMKGTIDSTRVYSRALSAAEILSNYQAGNIEIQTRVGADSSPDDGSWEDWKPVTNETAILNYDNYLYSTSGTNLISYWSMDETANNLCTGGVKDACDPVSNFDLTETGGPTMMNGKFGKARNFDGSTQYLSCTHANCGGISELGPSNTLFTLALWFKTTSTSATSRVMVSKKASTGPHDGYILYMNATHNIVCKVADGVNSATATSTNTYNDGVWHSVVCRSNGAALILYVDGVLAESVSTSTVGAMDSTSAFNIGSLSGGGSLYFPGAIDEVRFVNGTAFTAAQAMDYHVHGSTNPLTLFQSTDTTTKVESTASQKIETGRPLVDSNTVALWHMDETGGTGAYIKDSSANALNGTPTGTSSVNGISSKSRSFNGSSNFISVPDSSAWAFGSGNFSIEGWFNPAALNANGAIWQQGEDAGNQNTHSIEIASSKLRWLIRDASTTILDISSSNTLAIGNWYHFAVTRSGSNFTMYINGSVVATGTSATALADLAYSVNIGKRLTSPSTNYWYQGKIDEIRVSNMARTAEEIAEAYRAGRDHYLNKTISSTDLSAKTSLPFYIAADRPGTYLQAIVGESAYANYQPDTNTVGLWHLDEQSGSGAYLKDGSGKANHGTPTGTTYTQGKIGKGRSFNGTSDLVALGTTGLPTGTNPVTIEAWFNLNSGYANRPIIAGYGGNGTNDLLSFFLGIQLTTPKLTIRCNGADFNGNITISTGQWHHAVAVDDGTNMKLYLDGVLDTSGARCATTKTATIARIGRWVDNQNDWFNGSIDEVRISNTALSADQVRQAFEVGSRTHNITIDFGAKLDSGNLITASNDLGFTVDATYYGLQSKGSMLFKGDKIIVRENYDGTEYIAQGTVDSVNVSTGATTVSAWDGGSTFPSGGYTANASVFKWQREYWNPTASLSTHRDAVTNLTFRLTDGNEGRTIWIDDLKSSGEYLTNPAGSTITSSIGNRYFQYRAILTSNDSYVSPSLSTTTIDYVAQSAPNTPSLNAPTDTSINQTVSPVLQTTTTDTQSDYIRYKIELCTNVGMSSNCQTFDQTVSQTGWSGQNTQTNTAYTSGTQATYTIQTPLSSGTTYYWRSYAIDPAGLNVWSSTQGAPYSFTTQYATAITNEVIDNADTTDWISSDVTNTPNSTETTIKQEGSGSIKVITSADSSLVNVDLFEYASDNAANTAYVGGAGKILATGGTITSSGGNNIHRFTSSGTFTVTSGSDNINYLIVGGGGSGGSGYGGSGGGGGAGGFRTGTTAVSPNAYAVTVGNGGNALAAGATGQGNPGESSSAFSITSSGGGGGGSSSTQAGASGGSGGGGATGVNTTFGTGGAGTNGQGSNGGNGDSGNGAPYRYTGGGGGGAGAVGQNAFVGASGYAGSGGIGISSSISGSAVYYAGGGGGGSGQESGTCSTGARAQSSGGNGGGGAGGRCTSAGTSGTANTGGGGGGGAYDGVNGGPTASGAGGSGIVIVSYPAVELSAYSEASSKTEGSYSLKGYAEANTSLNDTLTRTVGSPVDLTNKTSVTFDIRASRTGSNIKVGLRDAGGTITEVTPNIAQANVFQSATIDLSGVSNANKDAIDKIIITVLNADAANTFYIDNMVSPATALSTNDTVTKTTSYYNLTQVSNITFWIRSTLTGSFLRFGFGEAAATEQYTDITINQANTWEQVVWDISGLSTAARDGVTKFAFTITGNTSGATFYFDDIRTNDLNAPTIGAATALSSSSIRWNFTDTTSTETGFKVYNNTGVLAVTCSTSNISSCDETGLSPNTSYTRKVAAYNSYGVGKYSGTATKYTLAAVPPSPFTFDRTNTAIKIGLGDGTNPAGTQYAIYKETTPTCDGSGGAYLAANGSGNGSTAVWQTRAQWGALSATGLDKETVYSFCVKARNTDNVETSFSTPSINNSGYIPLTGNATLASSSGTFYNLGSKYTEGNRGSRYITGVDNGTADNDPNTASISLEDGILTINSNETLVAGKFLFTGGSLAVASNGGELRPGAPLWIKDADADGYPESDTTWFGFNNKPTGGRRRGNLSSLQTADCNDGNGTYNVTCCTANGGACSANGTCCSGICGTNADGDNYFSEAAGTTGTCQATSKPYTDCGDGNANAYPGSTTCSSTSFTSTATGSNGNPSYNYNCTGGETTCGTVLYTWSGMSGGGYGCSKLGYCDFHSDWESYQLPTGTPACGAAGQQQNGGQSVYRYCGTCWEPYDGYYCCSQVQGVTMGGTAGNQACQ